MFERGLFRQFGFSIEPGKIYQMRQKNLPGYRFEYHPGVKRVYVIRVGSIPEHGEAFAFEIENHGQAWSAVLYWCRGFKEHERSTSITLIRADANGERKIET